MRHLSPLSLSLSRGWAAWVMLICLHGEAAAQSFHFKKITTEEGLSVNTVNCVTQDRQGFIWIGTYAGLNRFDGYNFKKYRHKGNGADIIAHNEIYTLYSDTAGYIWISTRNGLSRYDAQTNKVQFFNADTTRPDALPHYFVYAMVQLKDKVWLSTKRGLCYYQLGTGITACCKHPILSKIFSRNLLVFGNNLWISTNEGLYIYNTLTNETRKLFNGSKVFLCTRVKNSVLVLLENNRLVMVDSDLGTYTIDVPLKEGYVNTIVYEKDKNIWIGTTHEGIKKYDPVTTKITSYTQDLFNERSLSDNNIKSLYIDKSGLMWMCTSSGGVIIFNPAVPEFPLVRSPMYDGKGIFSNVLLGLCEDNDEKIWMGTPKGLTCWDKAKKEFRTWHHEAGVRGSINSNSIRSVCRDKQGNIWATTTGDGVNRFDAVHKTFTVFKRDTCDTGGSLSANFVFNAHSTKQGELWFASGSGISRYNFERNKIESFQNDPVLKPLYHVSVWKIFDDRQGRLWLGTATQGAYVYDQVAHTLKHYVYKKDSNSICDNTVWCIQQDIEGRLWFGTNNGLSILDERTGMFTHYSTDNKLPDDVIYGILPDDENNLWMSSNYGIIMFERKTGLFKNYTENDGLQSNEFNQEAFFKSRSGELYFGGVKGFNYFNPSEKRDLAQAPACFIAGFMVQDHDNIIPAQFAEGSNTRLDYTQDFVSFTYATFDYYHSAKCRYRYMLEGVDKDWTESGTNNKVSYTNLRPGSYSFKVICSVNGVNWSAKPATVMFSITPPFWLQWWFRLTGLILIPALIILFFRQRVRQIRIKLEQAEQIADLKMRALRAQMNPHFIFNSLNSIQHLIVKQDTDTAFSYLSKFSRLLRMVLDSSEGPYVSLQKELDMLNLYLDLEALRFDRNLKYEIIVESNDEELHHFKIPTLLLQPYVENSIWHGLLPKEGEKVLLIKVVIDEAGMRIVIEDNGIGRQKSGEIKTLQQIKYESKAMNINKSRLSLLSGSFRRKTRIEITDLYSEKGEPAGTRVEIKIPLSLLTSSEDE